VAIKWKKCETEYNRFTQKSLQVEKRGNKNEMRSTAKMKVSTTVVKNKRTIANDKKD